jgi:drug/metabolite transporter (DMT)-like permease
VFRLVSLGILSAAFFSSTFILNRAMSLQGGHWVWSASLRYVCMLVLLVVGLAVAGRMATLRQILVIYWRHRIFWTVAGSVGFGLFYSLICFSTDYAPGWVVATTWQATIIATPLVLLLFGKRTPLKALLFIGIIFVGILLVNLELAKTASLRHILLGGLPVLIAAMAYPLGNQMAWEAQKGGHKRIPHIQDPVLENPFSRVILLTLGSVPFWVVLILLTRPAAPSAGQWLQTALVALFSGVVATGLFLHARQLAVNAYEISAIDSTQSTEVVFSLIGEVLLLGGVLPGFFGCSGILLAVTGLVFYVKVQYLPQKENEF